MGPLAENKDEHFTYGDYLKWDDSERWELIDGIAYNMTPAPSRFHQQVSIELCFQLVNHLRDTTCKVYAAPFDVRLLEADEADESVTTVVQPDISVICDPSKLDDRGCKGSPDLIVEILSPATARKDWKEKFLRYERAGVREYWIADPSGKTVTVFKRSDAGLFGRPDVYGEEERIRVGILEDLEIDLQSVFME
ncbi:MAG TPA: Uma2 family endonuclease [Geomonas sp.]